MKDVVSEDLEQEMYAIGMAIKDLRESAGLTQEEAVRVAQQHGAKITVSTLSNWERSSRLPMMGPFWVFLRSLGFELADFDAAHSRALEQLRRQRPSREREMTLEEWAARYEEELASNPRARKALETLQQLAGHSRPTAATAGKSDGE